jgi:Domain of unknown function (DUF927)
MLTDAQPNGAARPLDLSALSPSEVETIALALRNDRNERQSKRDELRFGTNGSLAIDLRKRVWSDFETEESGGMLALVSREKSISKSEAWKWISELLGYTVEPKFHPVATWDYVDTNGNMISQVVRAETGEREELGKRVKSYWQRRPDGKGGWINKVKGIEPVPYRLPELIAAIAARRTIFIAEGEKCCDIICGLGLHATTNAGGAKKWRSELNHWFAGADIVLLPDNDLSGTGQKHAKLIGRSLRGVVRRIRIVDLSTDIDVGPKGDIEQWLARGGTKERLLELVEKAPEPTSLAADKPELSEDAPPKAKGGAGDSAGSKRKSKSSRSKIEAPCRAESRSPFIMKPDGLYWRTPDGDADDIFLTGPFQILAETRDDSYSWCLLLRWKDPDGRVKTWAMPKSLLKGDGSDVRAVFLDGGLGVASGTKARNLLTNYLVSQRSEDRACAVQATGWYENVFVFPDASVINRGGKVYH